MSVLELICFSNVVFKAYVYSNAVLVGKTLLMSIVSILIQHLMTFFIEALGYDATYEDPRAVRIRRAYLKDLENILPYFAIGFFYVLTNPSASLAVYLFRVFTLARIGDTLFYDLYVLPQRVRLVCNYIGFYINVFMAFCAIFYSILN